MVEADNGRLLGNFPQAFSHMALTNTAYRLATPEADRPKKGDNIAAF